VQGERELIGKRLKFNCKAIVIQTQSNFESVAQKLLQSDSEALQNEWRFRSNSETSVLITPSNPFILASSLLLFPQL
jgi:ribosome-associated toxin RatA of RatAB toxin-antitoxin module